MIMSGWKLYISGNTIAHSKELSTLLIHIIRDYNLTSKVATNDIIRRNIGKRIAWSSMVIYLTDRIFGELLFGKLISDIEANLANYVFEGNIIGARRISNKIHYRYDLVLPVNPVEGILYGDYINLYRGEGGKYNISGNKDLIK